MIGSMPPQPQLVLFIEMLLEQKVACISELTEEVWQTDGRGDPTPPRVLSP